MFSHKIQAFKINGFFALTPDFRDYNLGKSLVASYLYQY
jgi:hypothetical protein